jgi:hypothetical protein
VNAALEIWKETLRMPLTKKHWSFSCIQRRRAVNKAPALRLTSGIPAFFF